MPGFSIPHLSSRLPRQGRLLPSIDDVMAMAQPVLAHRMSLGFAARARGEMLTELIDYTCQNLSGGEAAA